MTDKFGGHSVSDYSNLLDPDHHGRPGSGADFDANGFGSRRSAAGGQDVGSTRKTIGIVLAVIACICFIASAMIRNNDSQERRRERGWDRCISQERARIADQGSLLEPEDFCSIRYPSHG